MNPSYAMLLYLSSIDPIRLWFESNIFGDWIRTTVLCSSWWAFAAWMDHFPEPKFSEKRLGFQGGGWFAPASFEFRILQISLAPRAIFRIYCIYLGKHDTCKLVLFLESHSQKKASQFGLVNYYELSLLLGCLPTKCAPTSCKWN